LLEEKGADVISSPAIEIEPLLEDPVLANVVDVIRHADRPYDWIVLLSANGVVNFAKALGKDARRLKRLRICVVGPSTERAVRDQGWPISKRATPFTSVGVLRALGHVRGKKILIPRVQTGPKDLIAALRRRGAIVEEVSAYRTRPVLPTPEARAHILSGVDAVSFTSASTARHFLSAFRAREREKIFRRAVAISMGPETTKELHAFKVKRIVQAKISTAEGLVQALCRI
jgi:uroporphyrinogen-III synthase